ncbi:hypothetical protein [Cytobacillus praedii]|uniref:hypothetical protein n=1 Tax=Cytobacillus praedii TaxID=1742358 RepID=UPI003AF79C5D
MKFQPKTDWKYDDIPTEGDFNRIEQGIADALEGNDPIIQQDTPPDGVKEGRLWLDTSDDTYQGTVFESLRGEIAGHLTDKKLHVTQAEKDIWNNINQSIIAVLKNVENIEIEMLKGRVIPELSYNDKITEYPMGISMMRVRSYIENGGPNDGTWYQGDGTVVTHKISDGAGNLQIFVPDDYANTGFYRISKTDGSFHWFQYMFGPSPWINTYEYGTSIYLDPINGSDDNDGATRVNAIKTVWKLNEKLKKIFLGNYSISIMSPVPNGEATHLVGELARMRSGGTISVDFGGSVLDWITEIEGCGVALKLSNFIATDRLQFRSSAPIYINGATFDLTNYDAYQDVLLVENGVLNGWNIEFKNAKGTTSVVYAGNASHVSLVNTKFTNCQSSVYGYTASNGLLMHTQTTTTGGVPMLNSQFGGGRIFT